MKSVLVVFLIYGFVNANPRSDPVVSTQLGLIRGVRADDGDFTKYLGIPYALVNETAPFALALSHPGFDDVFEANDSSTLCVQLSATGEYTGTIQCLILNIYVPDTASSENLLPVMFYIHGGGFNQGHGAGEYPKTLVENDVIVVSINYRLGIYGFLCLDIPEVPGNLGFKDQVRALRWVKENIEAFGGDPTNVTPFGQSAGAMAVNAHLFSDTEKLFDKAIIQSGPAVSPWFFLPSHSFAAFELAEYLGYNTTDINDAVAFLSTIEPKALTKASYDTGLISAEGTDKSTLKPCIEKKFDGVESFITEYPVNIKKAPKVKSTPIMIGHTNEELGVGFSAAPADGNYDNFEYMFSFAFPNIEPLNGLLDLIKYFYVGDEKVLGIDFRKQTADYGDDVIFNHPTQRMTEQFIDNGAEAVYRYIFAYVGDQNVTGASHASELGYLFDENQFVGTPSKDETGEQVTSQITTLWSNFAKYGNPTPEVTDLLPVEWKPATKENQYTLEINSVLTLESRPEQERMTFWDLLYRAYGQYQHGYQSNSTQQ